MIRSKMLPEEPGKGFWEHANLPSTISLERIEQDLIVFVDLLNKWQRIQNLVSRETLQHVWSRHIMDSLQLVRHIKSGHKRIVDFGSGGGFPTIPLSIAFKKSDKVFYLIDSNKRKVSFLKTVGRELNLNLEVVAKRVEAVGATELGAVDLITSRATASLANLLDMAEPFWSKNTSALFHKGAEYSAELEECSANWKFDVVCIASETSDSGMVLNISNLARKPA